MAYFIGIAGTHSTGKSSFIVDLKKRATDQGIVVKSIADTATNCRDAGFKILRDHTFESTLWIMCSVIRAELHAALNADLVLVDRPVPDALGYLEAALAATGRSIDPAQREYLYKLAEMHMPRYSLLFKTELDASIPLGPDRDPDLQFRASAGQWISHALATLNVSTRNPEDEGAAEAVERILAVISQSKERTKGAF